jgi:hypothetical protein
VLLAIGLLALGLTIALSSRRILEQRHVRRTDGRRPGL